MKIIPILSLIILAVLTCGFSQSETPEERLVDIAKEYKTYPINIDSKLIVADSSKYKWTIALCSATQKGDLGYHHEKNSVFFSQASPEKSPHGDKLYRLHVKNLEEYQNIESGQPIGQTLVKETWNVQKVPEDSIYEYNFVRQSQKDSNWYRPVSVSQLFIMYKEAPSENNDEGWVYGIVDLENDEDPQVLSKGNISTCISCHKNTKYDRLFGRK